MSIRKFITTFSTLVLLVGIIIMGCEGDDGTIGPTGFKGFGGPAGQNKQIVPPSDKTFGLMVSDGTDSDFMGVNKVTIDFITEGEAGNGDVVAPVAEIAPVIDGIDNGSDEWGEALSYDLANITVLGGNDNGVDNIKVRAAYNERYIYMQIKWTEGSMFPFSASANTQSGMWTYDIETSSWSQNAYSEDQLYIAWEISEISNWSTNGLGAIFDGSIFSVSNENEIADVWLWQSTQTNYTSYLADYVLRDANLGGLEIDNGSGFTLENSGVDKPGYMRSNSPKQGIPYPLWAFEYTSYNDDINWVDGAAIPGFVQFNPSGSVADIFAKGTFSNGVWTVELQRLRNTGNAEDTKF